jgi:hypothetical protein
MPITGTLTTDKATYNSGDLITATIKRVAISSSSTQSDTVSGTLTDVAGDSLVLTGAPVQITLPGVTIASTVGAVTDSAGRTFAKVSDDGATWIGTAKA